MQTKTTGRTMLSRSFFYGWIITAIAGLGVFFSGPGQTYSVSIFINSYLNDFHWSNALVSGVYSAATLCAGLLLFTVGRLVDRFGHRTMSVVIGSLLALACFWNSVIISPIILFLGFFMIRLFGQGSMTLLANTLVPQWFIEKRGRALSMMAIGGFLSSALLPPLNAWLITHYHWQMAWRFWGILLLVIYVPIAYFGIRNTPEDEGLLPDGIAVSKKINKIQNKDSPVVNEINWTLKEAMRTRAFWMILFCVSIPAMVNTGITFHLVPILGGAGIKTTTAALVLSIMALVGFPVTFISGWLADRYNVHVILSLMFIGHILAILLLIHVTSYWMAILYGFVWGIINGFE